jgi:hypothetical protein
MQKVYFSWLMQVYGGLNMLVVCVLSPCFLISYWSAGFGTFLQVLALAPHWLENFAYFTPTPEKNDQYSANHSCAIQAASHSTFINEQLYSTCDYRWNHKNKQLTL